MGRRRIGTSHDQRDPDRRFIHHLLGPQSLFTKHLAMVGKIDHQRVVELAAFLECLHDLANTGIQKACQSEIAGKRSMAAFSREMTVIIKEIGKVLDLWMRRHVLNSRLKSQSA